MPYLNTHAFSELRRSHFIYIWDYILTNLMLHNASRAASIHNMAMHEFKTAKIQGEIFVVPVMNHKTGHSFQ